MAPENEPPRRPDRVDRFARIVSRACVPLHLAFALFMFWYNGGADLLCLFFGYVAGVILTMALAIKVLFR